MTFAPGSETIQVCAACGAELAALDARSRCDCGGLLEARQPIPSLRGGELRALFAERRAAGRGVDGSGVWRYRELVAPGAADDEIVSHPEGNTPLLCRNAVARFAGVANLTMKHEGHNPTGSFKDRGMTAGVTQARRVGASAVACASTGNTSAPLPGPF